MRVREKFDPERTYVVNKPFQWAGDKYVSGQVFPAALAQPRRLRQMYESRFLRMAPEGIKDSSVPTKSMTPKMPPFAELSIHGLQQWLINNGVQIDGEPDKDTLVVLAQQRWQTLQEPKPETQATETGMTRYEQAAAEIGGLASKEELTDGIAVANGDREHSGQRVQGPVDDGNTTTGDGNGPGQQRRSNRTRGRDVQRRRH